DAQEARLYPRCRLSLSSCQLLSMASSARDSLAFKRVFFHGKAESKAAPGQRDPAASEVNCTT
ncbi:hypothetical protein, partial [Accumulibacter sp.]|uniref:hypothetical protein n=1 Tax=Accumulibacter sp. TaxID=2053492 RepID=UPI0026263DF9